MADKKKITGGDKPAQTIITKEEWDARLLAEHLLGNDAAEPLPVISVRRAAPETIVLDPFKTGYATGQILDAKEPHKS